MWLLCIPQKVRLETRAFRHLGPVANTNITIMSPHYVENLGSHKSVHRAPNTGSLQSPCVVGLLASRETVEINGKHIAKVTRSLVALAFGVSIPSMSSLCRTIPGEMKHAIRPSGENENEEPGKWTREGGSKAPPPHRHQNTEENLDFVFRAVAFDVLHLRASSPTHSPSSTASPERRHSRAS